MTANLENSVSSHRTGKGQFSFQSQRRAMPKNVLTTTQLWSFHMLERLLEKAMSTHSSTLAWKIPWTEEPGRLHAVHGVAKSQT